MIPSKLSIMLLILSIFIGCNGENETKNDKSIDFTLYEDAEDQKTDGWSVRAGSSTDATIRNVYDQECKSQVIQLQGKGTNDAYIIGAEKGETAWNETKHHTISWRMKYHEDCVFYVIVESQKGIRYLFYTPSYNRALQHGFEGGIQHGLGGSIIDGRWRRITRDLKSDLKDAEPDNELIAVNGLIVRGSGMIDDLLLYTSEKKVYEEGEAGIGAWSITDNEPAGAAVETRSDAQQGSFIVLKGAGYENAYRIGGSDETTGWNNQESRLLQWRFKSFGDKPEVMESRNTIRDMKAFEFRILTTTRLGQRTLSYTLGKEHLGVLDNGTVIHHALGDDRIRGSVLLDDNNTLGLWQTITRDVEEDIRDFESNNSLTAINGLQVRGSGWIDDIQSLTQIEP